ncbi:hypothetical protein HBB16_03000 [Pseudonocardia sp. MCCB 268]|nr:hypothetical protein [Pseudonocardia cytotoxica]
MIRVDGRAAGALRLEPGRRAPSSIWLRPRPYLVGQASPSARSGPCSPTGPCRPARRSSRPDDRG